MKYRFLFLLLLPLFAVGCSKAPLSLDQEKFAALSDLFSDSIGGRILVENVLSKSKAGTQNGDCAVIINDSSLLEDVIVSDAPELGTLSWPEIDFRKYSLVVGRWQYTAGNQYLASQKVQVAGNSATLVLEIKEYPGGGTCDVFYRWFGALYPKLPAARLKIKRINNY